MVSQPQFKHMGVSFLGNPSAPKLFSVFLLVPFKTTTRKAPSKGRDIVLQSPRVPPFKGSELGPVLNPTAEEVGLPSTRCRKCAEVDPSQTVAVLLVLGTADGRVLF